MLLLTLALVASSLLAAASPEEEGEIVFEVYTNDNCGVITLDKPTCLYNFFVPTNACDGPNNRRGGIWNTECLLFIIEPNPVGC